MSANVLVVTDAAPFTRTASSLLQAHAASFAMHRLSSIKNKGLGSMVVGSLRRMGIGGIATFIVTTKKEPQAEYALGVLVD